MRSILSFELSNHIILILKATIVLLFINLRVSTVGRLQISLIALIYYTFDFQFFHCPLWILLIILSLFSILIKISFLHVFLAIINISLAFLIMIAVVIIIHSRIHSRYILLLIISLIYFFFLHIKRVFVRTHVFLNFTFLNFVIFYFIWFIFYKYSIYFNKSYSFYPFCTFIYEKKIDLFFFCEFVYTLKLWFKLLY
jgi:hypothetical protein